MEEIIYQKLESEKTNTEERCLCGGEMNYGTIPCPDGKEGCLVGHYGYRCLKCGRIFQ